MSKAPRPKLQRDGSRLGKRGLRSAVSQTIAGALPRKAGILAALHRSPLVGAKLDLQRKREVGRKIKL